MPLSRTRSLFGCGARWRVAADAVSVRRGVHDHDLGVVGVAGDALPHDRVGQAEVGPHQHDDVGLLEVGVAVGRGVEPERLLVGGHRGGHALAGVPVAVAHPHAELGQRAQERHLLGDDLTGGQERHRLRSVLGLHGPHAGDEGVERGGPVHRPEVAVVVSQQRGGGAVGRGERGEGLPPLGAGHAQVHRVVVAGGEAHRLALVEVDVESAAGGAEPADQPGGGGGLPGGGHLGQPEPGALPSEAIGERSAAAGAGQLHGGLHRWSPYWRGATDPRKNSRRSVSSATRNTTHASPHTTAAAGWAGEPSAAPGQRGQDHERHDDARPGAPRRDGPAPAGGAGRRAGSGWHRGRWAADLPVRSPGRPAPGPPAPRWRRPPPGPAGCGRRRPTHPTGARRAPWPPPAASRRPPR
jgi:hypothetical protein